MQYKIIEKHVLRKTVTDPDFANRVFSELPYDAFSEDLRDIVLIVKDYYRKNPNAPLHKDNMKSLVEQRATSGGWKPEKLNDNIDIVTDIYTVEEDDGEGDESLEESVYSWCKNKLVYKAMLTAINNSDKEGKTLQDDDVINKLVDDLQRAQSIGDGRSSDESINPLEEPNEVYEQLTKLSRHTTPTGFRNVDEMLSGGGLAPGELALIVSPSGGGKTTIGMQLMSNAYYRGKNVLYVSLEEIMPRILYRIINVLSNGEFYNKGGIKQSDNNVYIDRDVLDETFSAINAVNRKINGEGVDNYYMIESRNAHELSLSGFEQMIIEKENELGTNLDVVILDYAELLRYNQKAEYTQEMGRIYEGIRAIARKHNFVIWTFAQTNRTAGTAIKEGAVTTENIQGSYRVIQACELVLTVNRTAAEKSRNLLRLHVDKVRNPKFGFTLPEFLYFKVLPKKGYRVIPEDITDINKHQQLLDTADKEKRLENSAKKQMHTTQAISNFNTKLERGEIKFD